MSGPRVRAFDRFVAKVEPSETGCWLWIGSVGSHGYGQMYFEGGPRLAHRISYEFFIGPIPAGLQPDHLCRVRRCVNPTHLEAVTPRTNSLRGTGPAALNAAKTHCPSGHSYDDANTCVSRGVRYCRTCAREKMARRAVGASV